MLPHKIIQQTLRRHPQRSEYDQKFFKWRMEEKGYEDVITFVRAESNVLLTQLRNEAKILEVCPQLVHWLDNIPILWIPSQAFVAETVPYRGEGYIVFSDGFLSLTEFTAEFSIVRAVLSRRQDLDRRTDEEREIRIDNCTNCIYEY